jgi:hypothetical protein
MNRILASFEEHHRLVTEIKEDEILRLMCHKGTKVPAYNAVPMR